MKTLLTLCLTFVLGVAAVSVVAQSPAPAAPTPATAQPSPPALEAFDDADLLALDPEPADMGKGPGPGGPPGFHKGQKRQWIMQELNLTADQRTKLADIRDRQARVGIDQRAKIQIARLDLRKLVRADKPDRAAIDRQIDEVSRLEATLKKSRTGAMLDMRVVLTAEQRKKLEELKAQGPPRRG